MHPHTLPPPGSLPLLHVHHEIDCSPSRAGVDYNREMSSSALGQALRVNPARLPPSRRLVHVRVTRIVRSGASKLVVATAVRVGKGSTAGRGTGGRGGGVGKGGARVRVVDSDRGPQLVQRVRASIIPISAAQSRTQGCCGGGARFLRWRLRGRAVPLWRLWHVAQR